MLQKQLEDEEDAKSKEFGIQKSSSNIMTLFD
jgi:hypothetical protein